MKLTFILVILMATNIFVFGQGTNAPEQRPFDRTISYEERVARGFGQRQEPRWAGDKPAWMRRGEQAQRGPMGPQFRGGQGGPRGPMMGQGRGQGGPRHFDFNRGPEGKGPRGPMMGQGQQFRGKFRGEGAIQRVCPLCEKHKKMMSKKHVEKRGGQFHQRGPRHPNFVK